MLAFVIDSILWQSSVRFCNLPGSIVSPLSVIPLSKALLMRLLIDWLIHTRFQPSVWTAMPEWPSFGTSCRTASTPVNAPHFTTLVLPATSSAERSSFYLRIYTYPLTEVLCLWLLYKALTRRPTVLLCLRSLDTWWATATVKPCCNSAGHSNRDSTTPLVLTGKTLPNNVSLVQIASSIPPQLQNPVDPDSPNLCALCGSSTCCVLCKLGMLFRWGFENLPGRTTVIGNSDVLLDQQNCACCVFVLLYCV